MLCELGQFRGVNGAYIYWIHDCKLIAWTTCYIFKHQFLIKLVPENDKLL